MKENRVSTERRGYVKQKDRTDKCNRRFTPDRRLNNIAVEWIPFSHVHLHPVARLVFSRD